MQSTTSLASDGKGWELCAVCSDIIAEENLYRVNDIHKEPNLLPYSEFRKLGIPQENKSISSIDGAGLSDHRLTCESRISIKKNKIDDDDIQNLASSYCLKYTLSSLQHVFQVKIHLAPIVIPRKDQRLYSGLNALDFQDDSTASDASWARCVAWLTSCTSSHKACGFGNDLNGSSPTRLIEVGTKNTWPRVCYSRDIKNEKYVTLSHCWGTSKMPTLTRETSEGFMKGIDPESLPKTFQDAITITRRLRSIFGVRYLWIDALCIFQNSPDDWRHEGSRMDDVYMNAWCNISAANGVDGRSGLFSPKSRAVPRRVFLRSFERQDKQPVNRIAIPETVWNDVKNSTLSTRAWVHQEQTLSRRILYFTDHKILWECQRWRASEEFGPFPKEISNLQIERILLSHEIISKRTADRLIQLWACCVQNFTKGKLSYPGDKLPAISGLARRLQQYLPDARYLAGLWSIELENQLLWIPNSKFPVWKNRSEAYRAPSWTWACIDGPIKADGPGIVHSYFFWNEHDSTTRLQIEQRKGTLLVRVDDVTIETVGVEPFGQVSAGELRLVGPLWACFSRGQGSEICIPPTPFNITPQIVSCEAIDCYFESVDSDFEFRTPEFCYAPFHMSQAGICGLILERIMERKGVYQRVGVFVTRPFDNPEYEWYAPVNFLDSKWKPHMWVETTPPEECFERLIDIDKHLYTII